jgi:hypothetical protein
VELLDMEKVEKGGKGGVGEDVGDEYVVGKR